MTTKAERQRVWQKANPGKMREYSRAWRAANPERAREVDRAWKKANPDKRRAGSLAYRVANPEAVRESLAAWRASNLESERAKARVRVIAWAKANRGRALAMRARRKLAKIQRTPAWANRFFIEEAYDLIARRATATGIKWHVDHILLLQGRKVSGLHVENNLQVIPALDNIRKHNRYEVDSPTTKRSKQ